MSAPARWIVDVQGFQVSMMNLVGHQTQQFGCFFIAAVGSLMGHGRQIEAPKMAQVPQTVVMLCIQAKELNSQDAEFCSVFAM